MAKSVRRLINSVNYRLINPIFGRNARQRSAKIDFEKAHRSQFRNLRGVHTLQETAEMFVGGEFVSVGTLLRDTLIHYGLKPNHYLIDVGCGSGRLAKPLSQYLKGKYLGIDVVPELVDYARTLVAKQDWRFEVAKGLTIPEQDRQADIVCFFSVLTHLLHEESYLYLLEAKRVLKPGGKIVASFLDFKIDAHWSVFEDNLKDVGIGEKPLNVFMSADLMQKWAKHLDLEVEAIKDGDEKHILLSQPITFSSGETVEGTSAFGQSLCVLVRKP